MLYQKARRRSYRGRFLTVSVQPFVDNCNTATSVPRNKVSPLFFVAILFCLILGPASYGLYFLFGHQIITFMYTGDSSSLLNHLLQQRNVVPLSFYLDLMDKNAHKFLYLPISTFLFYFAAYKTCSYFLNKDKDPILAPTAESSGSIKHDLLIAILAYSVLVVIYFLPILTSISFSLLGPPEDNMKYLWNMWWGYKSLIDKSGSLTYSNYIFYPEGSSLLYNDYSWYNLFVSLGLSSVLNPIAAYNLVILHTFIVSGIGAFLLTKYLTQNSLAAIVAGFIYGFNPSHFGHSLHHINTSSIQFIPFFVLFFLKSMRHGSLSDLMMASIFFLLNALCDWNYLIFECYFMGFAYVYGAVKRQKIIRMDILSKIALMVTGPVVILSPWLFKMMVLGLKTNDVNLYGHNRYVADIIGLVVPHFYHPLGRAPIVDGVNATFTGNHWESAVYLGLVNIITIIILFKKIVRQAAVYFCGLFLFLILSMGSFVHLLGQSMPVILPYSVLANIPFVSNARAPSRYIVFVYLFLAIIMGHALKYLHESYKNQTFKKYGLVVISLLIMGDYYSVSSETTKVYVPRCYGVIAEQQNGGGMLDLPGGWEENARYMMYQTYHEIPIVQGAIPRKIGRSLIDELELGNLETQMQQLAENGIKHIVIHKRPVSERSQVDADRYRRVYKNICEDDDNVVFEAY
jgi:hypothetical protein